MRHITAVTMALALCIFASATAFAQADMGFKAVGLEIGMVSPEDVDATFGVGVFANLGTIVPQVKIESYLDYWSKSEDVVGGGEVSARDIALGAKGMYMFKTSNPKVRPFAGVGLGIHFLKAQVDIPAMNIGGFITPATTVEDSSTKLGLDIGGGIAAPINPRTEFIGELWYGFVSDFNQLSLKVGVSYQL